MTDTATEATRTAEAKPAKVLTAKEIAANKAAALKEREELLAGFQPQAEQPKSLAEQGREARLADLEVHLSTFAVEIAGVTAGTDAPELEVAALKSLTTVGHRARKAIAEIPDAYFEDQAQPSIYPAGDFA